MRARAATKPQAFEAAAAVVNIGIILREAYDTALS
jgi:hypothetical protein